MVNGNRKRSPERIRCGFAELQQGTVVRTGRRLFPKHASLAEVLLRRRLRGGRPELCRVYWHIPLLRPGVLSVDYIHAGAKCHWRDIVQASAVLDRVAAARGCLIAVCHVTNDRLSDRVMARLGYDRHCLQWSGRHFIKRYDVAPQASLAPAFPSLRCSE